MAVREATKGGELQEIGGLSKLGTDEYWNTLVTEAREEQLNVS